VLLGLRTTCYPTDDLDASKAWFTEVLGVGPYFDEPFYVGFEVGGYELSLSPSMAVADGPLTYWGVPDCDAALARLVALGASVHEAVTEVGGGIRVATVVEPAGSRLGIIENPHFALPPAPPEVGEGPGR
jgi:predicted enzyme related to lactoylglutathione lyase